MCKWILLIITATWIVVCECKQSWRNNKKPTIQHQANKDYRCNSLTSQKCNSASTYTEKHCTLSSKTRASMIQSSFATIVISLSYVYWLLQLTLPWVVDRGGWTDEIRTDLSFHPRPEMQYYPWLKNFWYFLSLSIFPSGSEKKSSKHWKPQKETSKQKMQDLQNFTGLIWIDVHKHIQNKVHLSLFWGIKFFWNWWICKHFFQTLKTLTVSFPVADGFWVRCFWKSKDWLYRRKEWVSSCSNLGSESNTLQKCLLSAVMHLFLETNIATKGCSHSQHSPAWGYARSTFPRYVCSSCRVIFALDLI